MRYVFIIVLALIDAPLCLHPPVRAQDNVLDPYIGRDLWKQRLSKNEQLVFAHLVGDVPKGDMTEPVPWHVWKTAGGERYVVLLGESLMTIPGGSSACVQLFDSTNRRTNSWSFRAGWRAELYDASMEYSKELDSDLIVLRTAPVINGRNIAKEFFALKDDRLRFIRLENDKGKLVQNEYIFPNYEIGIIPNANTVEQWTALLQSKEKADVLSALVFLGGKHIDELLPGPRESTYVNLYRELAASARIHELIEGLSKSENAWIREAALLALNGPRKTQNPPRWRGR
jgi:hypothetical protein